MKYKLLMTVLILGIFVQPSLASTTFNDVNSNTPYQDDIYWTVNNHITSGYGDGNWGPNDCVTRAQALKMLFESEISVDYGITADKSSNPFSDFNKSYWAYDYIVAANAYHYVEGYEDGTFRPDNCVARNEAMKLALVVAMPYQEDFSDSPLFYDDKAIVDIAHYDWSAPYARTMFKHRIVGTEHTASAGPWTNTLRPIYFYPDQPMTRKEFAHMVKEISVIYPRLGCESSGGSYKNGGSYGVAGTCDCSKVDSGNGHYNDDRGYCEMKNGDPAGDLNKIFKTQKY